MIVVIGLVLAAAALGALGLVLLRKATESEPRRSEFSVTLLWRLIRYHPTWAVGLGAIVASFVLQIAALANGPVSLVQLVVVMELPLTLIGSALVLGGRLQIREWAAIAAMSAGVAGLLVSLSPTGGDPAATGLATWLVGLAVTLGLITAALVVSRRTRRPVVATALSGVAAGMSAGLGAVLVKAIAAAFGGGLVAVVATWQTWVLLAVGTAGFFLLQNALQAGRLVASQPGITLANPLVATIWGVALLGEQVRTGWWLAGAALGGALLAAGVILLAGSPLLEGHREAPDDSRDGPATTGVTSEVATE